MTTAVSGVDEDKPHHCSCCGAEAESERTFLIPELGFIADSTATKKPGLIRPQRTYNNEIAYIHQDDTTPLIPMEIGNGQVEMGISSNDEMALVNRSQFYVCESCGYTALEEKTFFP